MAIENSISNNDLCSSMVLTFSIAAYPVCLCDLVHLFTCQLADHHHHGIFHLDDLDL